MSEDVALRRFEDVERFSGDKDEGGDQHEGRGYPEGQGVAGVVVRVEAGDVLSGKERPGNIKGGSFTVLGPHAIKPFNELILQEPYSQNFIFFITYRAQ